MAAFSCHFFLLQLHLQLGKFEAFLTQPFSLDINGCCLVYWFIDQGKVWDAVTEDIQSLPEVAAHSQVVRTQANLCTSLNFYLITYKMKVEISGFGMTLSF